MSSTRIASAITFLACSFGLSMLVLGESPLLNVGGAALTTAGAIYLTRHFWREAGRKTERTAATSARTLGIEVSKVSSDVRHVGTSLGKDTEVVSDRVTAFSRGVLEYVSQLELDVAALRVELERHRESTRKGRELIDHRAQRYRDEMIAQLSGVMGIYEILQPRVPYPSFGGWAIDGDCARQFVTKILTDQPQSIVELGSGLSTILAGQALDRVGADGRVISLEHDERWAVQTRRLVEQHGVSHRCVILHAPLVETTVDGQTFQWYDLSTVELPETVELILVDGPPKATGPRARYPSLPMLYDRLSVGGTVLIDDASRPDEREAVAMWGVKYPALSVTYLSNSKGLAEIVKGPG